jgi:hypothetical protein
MFDAKRIALSISNKINCDSCGRAEFTFSLPSASYSAIYARHSFFNLPSISFTSENCYIRSLTFAFSWFISVSAWKIASSHITTLFPFVLFGGLIIPRTIIIKPKNAKDNNQFHWLVCVYHRDKNGNSVEMICRKLTVLCTAAIHARIYRRDAETKCVTHWWWCAGQAQASFLLRSDFKFVNKIKMGGKKQHDKRTNKRPCNKIRKVHDMRDKPICPKSPGRRLRHHSSLPMSYTNAGKIK